MVSNNICDLAKLRAGALAMFQNGEIDGVLSKEDKALLGSSEVQPSQKTTKGGKTTKGKGKTKEAPAVDPKVAQLRADYEALNAIQHERDLQYRELQAENKLLIKALQDKKAKKTAEAKLAYEKRKAERTPEQQAKIDAQTQKMLEGAKRAREAKKAQEAINPSSNKTVAGIIKQAIKKKKDKAEIDAEIKRKQDLKDATEAKYKGDALKPKLKELQNDPVALENAKQAMEDDVAPQTPDELLANLLVKSQAERKKSETWEIAKGIADYNRDIKNAPTREKRQAQTDLINKTNETYKGEALQAKLKELEANQKALLKAKKEIENGVDPLTPDDLLAHKLVRQAMATGKSKPLVSDLSKGFADYNREKASAPAREAQQARKDLLATTDAQYKGDDLQAKLKEIKANEEAMANAKKQIEANQDPTTPEELLAHNLVKQTENKSKIKPKITDLSKGFSKFANNERLAPKREAQALFNTKQQELRNEINQAFPDGKGGIDKKALQEHIQEMRDDKALLEKARNEVKNKQAPYSMESYLSHEIVKKLDAKKKELKEADATIQAVRKALKKTQDPDTLREKLRRKQAIKNFEEELLEKYDTVDKLKKAVQAVKDNPDLLEETRKLIANGGFPTTLEQYIAMHQLKREKKPAGMPNKPSDLSKALTSVNREPNAPPTPEELQARAKKKLEKQQKLLKENTALLEDLKAGKSAGYLSELQKKRFDAILAKENKTDLEKELIALSQELGKERSKVSKDQADLVFNSLQNKENLTPDEETVLNAILATNAKKLEQSLTNQQNALEAKTAELARLKNDSTSVFDSYTKKLGLLLKKENKLAKKTELQKKLLEISKEIGTEKAKMSKEHANMVADALKNKENLTPDEQKVLDGIVAQDKKAYRKKLDNYLIEKVPNATPRMRKSAVDRLMELYADGRTLTPEQFKTVMKQEMVPSGVTASFQNKLKELQAELDAVDASDKRADIKFDEKLLLKGQINAELASLIKPNMGDKFNANLFIEPLLNIGSAFGDVLGSLNAVANHMLVDKLTRVVMGVGSKIINKLGKKGGLSKADYGGLSKEQIAKIKEFDNSFTTNFKYAMENFNFKHFFDGKARNEAQQAKKLWKPLQYTLDGHVAIGHDEVFSDKLSPKFAYENKGWKGASFIDKAETAGHHLELLGKFRLNATDIPILDFVYRNKIGQTIIDGLKEDPNFKLTEEHVKNAHAFSNTLLFKSENFVTQNMKSLRDWADFKLDVGGNKVTIPIGSIIHRYTRTPINYTLRSLDVTGLADLRFLFGYMGKALNKQGMDNWGTKLLNAGITKYELKKGKKGEYYPEAILDEKTNKPVLISDKQHDFAMVQGVVKMALSGTLGTAIFMLGKNTDIFSTGYVKETSDTEEAEGTRNDFYLNSSAALRAMTGGNGRNQKGDWMFPLSKLLGQHTFGAQTTVKLAKKGEVTGEEANLIADFFNASQNQFGEGAGLFNWADVAKKPVETIIERLPKVPFLGAIGRDAVNFFDDTEKVTKGKDFVDTSINRYFNGSVFKALGSPKSDVTGEKVHAGGWGKALGFPFKIAKADPVIKELRKVSRESSVDVQLKQVDNNFRIGKTLAEDYGTEPQNMKLNAKDFSKWQEIHNNIVYQSVKTMVESEDYKSLTNPIDKADKIKTAKENPSVEINGKDYTPKELFLEYKLKGRVVNINK